MFEKFRQIEVLKGYIVKKTFRNLPFSSIRAAMRNFDLIGLIVYTYFPTK